jgi:putative addiction module component (TIGR02574 family)
MSRRRDVFAEAMALPLAERARLANELIHSLDEDEAEDPVAVAEAWDEEIARRVADFESGRVKGEPWSKVEARIRRQLRARSPRSRAR